MYKGVGLDTGDQAVSTVGQTDGHSSPDHTKKCADVHGTELDAKIPY